MFEAKPWHAIHPTCIHLTTKNSGPPSTQACIHPTAKKDPRIAGVLACRSFEFRTQASLNCLPKISGSRGPSGRRR